MFILNINFFVYKTQHVEIFFLNNFILQINFNFNLKLFNSIYNLIDSLVDLIFFSKKK